MTIPAILFQAPLKDGRGADRVRVRLGAIWLDQQPYAHELSVLDISISGFLLETGEPLPVKTSFIVELPDGVCKVCRIVWSSGRFRGAVFSEALSEAELQNIIVASVARLSRPDEHIQQGAPSDHDIIDDWEPRHEAANDDDKLPFAARVRIIFGSAAILWAVAGSLAWSAIEVI
jgi:hypothetical protein